MKNNKKIQNLDVNDINQDLQPRESQIKQIDTKEPISDEQYQSMLNEINFFDNSPKYSLYDRLDKNPNAIDPSKRPRVTRSKKELYRQLKFYDELKQKNVLSDEQIKLVDFQVKKIYEELKINNQYDFFLSQGYDKVDIDKNAWKQDLQFLKFYQRDDDIKYNDLKRDYIDIGLPEDKWWVISQTKNQFNSIRKGSMFELNNEFVDTRARLSNMYDANQYIDNIILDGIEKIKEATDDTSLYEYNPNQQNQQDLNKSKQEHKEQKEKSKKFSFFKKKEEDKKEIINKTTQQENKTVKLNQQVPPKPQFNNLPPINKPNNQVKINLANNTRTPPPPPLPNKSFGNSGPQKQFFDYQNHKK